MRVLILSTSAGSGHVAAARALEQVFQQTPGITQVVSKDALEFTNDTFRALYSDLFLELVKNNPLLVGWWYDESDTPGRTDEVRLLIDRLNTEPLEQIHSGVPAADYRLYPLYAGWSRRPSVAPGADQHPPVHRHDRLRLPFDVAEPDFPSLLCCAARDTGAPAGARTARRTDYRLGHPGQSGIGRTGRSGKAVLERYQLRDDLPILLLSAGAIGGGPITRHYRSVDVAAP
jgi:processive 1,2-diacylglycerol beta-glucosyltransferase